MKENRRRERQIRKSGGKEKGLKEKKGGKRQRLAEKRETIETLREQEEKRRQ